MALMFSACNGKACKRICECMQDNSDSCKEDCKDEMDNYSDDCQRAIRKAAKCLDKNSCDASSCVSESTDVNSKCDFGSSSYYYYY